MPRSVQSPLVLAFLALAAVPSWGGAQAPTAAPTDPAARLTQRLRPIMDRPEFRHATWGIEFYSLDEDRPVYALNPDQLFTAASTTKLLTTGTALRLLGADYRFHTNVYRTGPIDRAGTLKGDLVLVASGDLNLSGRIQPGDTLGFTNEDHAYDADPSTSAVPGDPLLVIRQLAAQVAAHGVKRITGRVLVDVSMFREGARELGTGVVMSPVVVNDNLVDLTIGPGASVGAATTVAISPATAYVRFVNKSTTTAAGTTPSITWSSDVTEPDGSHTVTISGRFPMGTKAILYSYAVPEPSRFAQVALVQALREKGVTATLPAASVQKGFTSLPAAYRPENVVAEHVSPPLAEEIKVTLKVSQNLHASSLPMIVKAVLARDDTSKTGFDLERGMLQTAGLDLGGAQQTDGAGGDARFSPSFMVHYLAYMAKQKDAALFERSLPILGRDGTLWNIQPDVPAAGHVFAKTGTLAGYDALNRQLLVTAKGLGGYFTSPGGKRYALAIYVNNVSVPLDQGATTKIVGQALGEVAAAAYATLP
ncbi:MAG: D-alanyl-D-alanine carboxypeptidase/D-alanyl-D-alanine-endopeptidase [Gemmatimonadaceae bacterium]|nr:D-alanyl-D-alanine carboxypeptidase/D-alanyl-D-alanine-endopeptidase [Gemmatimonadaceae bacterium]NUR33049.1 D-alanyl-D-alanine carboxypeptidase/D-alanyl-D-alanine-endopeptidase [Gemmatimonadaceae bacterium]